MRPGLLSLEQRSKLGNETPRPGTSVYDGRATRIATRLTYSSLGSCRYAPYCDMAVVGSMDLGTLSGNMH